MLLISTTGMIQGFKDEMAEMILETQPDVWKKYEQPVAKEVKEVRTKISLKGKSK
jgi:hypothetical protein